MATKRSYNMNGMELEFDEPQLQFDDDELNLQQDPDDMDDSELLLPNCYYSCFERFL